MVLLSIAAMLLTVSLACLAAVATGGSAADLSSWIEALATLTAVVAVIVAWIQLGEGREAAREQAEQAAQAALDQARPYVLVSATTSPISIHFIDLVVENVGAGPAYDVEITVDPLMLRANTAGMELGNARIFSKPIKMLPPRYEMRSFFDSALERNQHPELPEVHDVTIRYHDGRGHSWTEELIIDLTLPQGLLFTEEYSMHHLAKAVREIEKHIKKSPLTNGTVEAVVEGREERRQRQVAERQEQAERLAAFRAQQAEATAASEQVDVDAGPGPDGAAAVVAEQDQPEAD